MIVSSQSARLNEIEKLLPAERFLRTHRSYLVNLDHVRKADREINAFVMENGDRCGIGCGVFDKCELLS